MTGNAFVVDFMTKEEISAIESSNDEQLKQSLHNKPRHGFAHNCYKGGLGMFFQKTVKNGIIEKLINSAWISLIKYRTNGNKTAFREGKRHPERVFVYDDELFSLLNRAIKSAADDWCTDNDSMRKRELVHKATDILLMIPFEDVYYRALMKRALDEIVSGILENPRLLDLDMTEERIDAVFNRYNEVKMSRNDRRAAYMQWLSEYGENE